MKKIKNLIIKYKTLIANFSYLSIAKGLDYILPLIVYPYLAVVLGADKFGLVFFGQAFVEYFAILIDYGFDLSATREVSENRDKKNKLSEIVSSIFMIKMILLLISLLCFILIIFLVPKFRLYSSFYCFWFFTLIGRSYLSMWFFQGMEKMKFVTIIDAMLKITYTVLIFLFVKDETHFYRVPIYYAAGYGIACIFVIRSMIINFKIQFYLCRLKDAYQYFRSSTNFFLSRLSVSAFSNTNTFVTNMVLGNVYSAYYSAAEKLYRAIVSIYQPITLVLYPYMAKEKNIRFYRKAMSLIMGLNMVLCIGVYAFSPFIVRVMYGSEFSTSADILRILSIVAMVQVPSILLGYPLLGTMGYSRWANNSVIAGSFFHIVMIMLMLNTMNVFSIPLLMMVTEFIIMAIRWFGVEKFNFLSGKVYEANQSHG